jgi:hypothetical protein
MLPMKKQNAPAVTGNKTCFCCGQEKHVTEFHAHKQMKDGRLNKCAACVRQYVTGWKSKNPRDRAAEWKKTREKKGLKTREQWLADVKTNAKGKRVTALEWYHRNKESADAYRKTYAKMNKEKISQKNKKWGARKRAAKDPIYYATRLAAQRKREAAKLNAVPAWADDFVTKGMYQIASVFRRIGINMQVDHIVPLQGATVSGLHWHENMQLMTGTDNSSKHNRYWPDMWQGNTP